MTVPWGVAFRSGPETVTLSDAEDFIDVDFTTDGERLNEFGTPWAAAFPADMAWDAGRGVLWQVNVEATTRSTGWIPTTGPWSTR